MMNETITLTGPEVPQLRQMVLENTKRINRNEQMINQMRKKESEEEKKRRERDEFWESVHRKQELSYIRSCERMDRLEKFAETCKVEHEKSFQELKEMFKETDKIIKETGKQIKETDKIIKETGKQIKETGEQIKETGEQIKETDKIIKETGEQIKETDKIIKEAGEQIKEAGEQIKEAREIIKEAGEIIKETGEQIKETDKIVKEASKTVREAGEQIKETDKIVRENSEQLKKQVEETTKTVREMSIQFLGRTGHIVEGLLSSSAEKVFQEAGLELYNHGKNFKRKLKSENKQMEVDVILSNDEVVVPIEVKTNCTKADIHKFLHQMGLFRDLFPEYANKEAIAAIAAINYEDEVDTLAHNEGLLVIRVNSDDIFSLDPFKMGDLRRF